MRFYIASSFSNIETVRYVSGRLKNLGFFHTYDWTQNERSSTIQQLRDIGQKEKDAIMEADFIVVLLPAGKGSHIEFGIALAQNKTIYLHSPNDEVHNFETTSTFYHLPEVKTCNGTIENLIETISLAGKSSKVLSN